MAGSLSSEDVIRVLSDVLKHGFGRVEIVIINGSIKTISATKTMVKNTSSGITEKA